LLPSYNYIAIEGAIGAGKTTLAKLMAQHYESRLVLEGFSDNEFLPKFYKDPGRYAFPLELSFLAERFQQIKKEGMGADLFNHTVISDYFLSKSVIFARTNLQDDEYRLFRELFDIMFQSVPKPDLLMYLYLPVEKLMENIRKRGRGYEQNIAPEYLHRLQSQYLEFLNKHHSGLRILVLDVSEVDFVKNKKDFNSIIDIVEKPVSEGVHQQVV
jgi:deoxyadenosine/deoxycytidine kinase